MQSITKSNLTKLKDEPVFSYNYILVFIVMIVFFF